MSVNQVLHAPHPDIAGAPLCLRYNARRIATAEDQRQKKRVTCKACLEKLPEAAARVIAKSSRLEVVETATGEVVKVIDLTHLGERQMEKALSGLLRNMNTERFHVVEVP